TPVCPPAPRVILPVTRACAFVARHSPKLGPAWLIASGVWVKAAGSIGLNSPELSRLLVMISLKPPASSSCPLSAEKKAVMAIGIGLILAVVTSTCNSARAGRLKAKGRMIKVKRRIFFMSRSGFLEDLQKLAWIESNHGRFPFIVFIGRQ